MNPRVLIVVVLALVCGLSAMFLVQALRRPVSAPTVERAGVVFATEDVKAGEVVTEKGLEVRQIPLDQVPEGAVKTIAEAVDRAARSTIDKGDMLREVKLAEKGAGRGLAALVDPGMRAVVIQTPSFSASLGGFLQPGNHVDINLTLSASPAGREPPRTLLEDVEVLAVDKNVNQPTSNKINSDETRFVTVEVNPEDALKLDFGQNAGVLTLKLRNPGDKARDPGRLMTLAELQGYKPKVDGEAPPPKPLDQLVAVGKQAFTIDAGSFSATLAGHLAPESRVDVLLTVPGEGRANESAGAARVAGAGELAGEKAQGDEPGKPSTPAPATVAGGGGASTRTLLKDVRVLLVQSKEDAPNIVRGTATADSRYVTLEVDPAEARQLDLAQQVGKLHLSLRGTAPPGFAALRLALAKFAGRVADGVREVAATGTAPTTPAEVGPKPGGGDGDLLVAAQLGMSPPPTPATRPALDRLIAPGMQAFTVDADSFSGTLAGHLSPDSRVDVLLTSETLEKYKEYTGGASTRTLLGDVRVLLVQPKGSSPGAAANVADARYVTLEVTADQARRLDLGQKMGKLHLSLRSAARAEGPAEPSPDPAAPGAYAGLASAEPDEPDAEPASNPDLLLFHDLKMIPAGGGGGAGGPKVLADMQVRTMRGTRAGRDSWTVVDDPAARRAARMAPAAPASRPEPRPRRPAAREPLHLTGSR